MRKEVLEKKLQKQFAGANKRWSFNGGYFETGISMALAGCVLIQIDFKSRSGYFEVIPYSLRFVGEIVELSDKKQRFEGENAIDDGLSWLAEYLLNLSDRLERGIYSLTDSRAEYRNKISKIIA